MRNWTGMAAGAAAVAVLALASLGAALWAQSNSPSRGAPAAPASSSPAVPRSLAGLRGGAFALLGSPRGLRILQASPSPAAKALLKRTGQEVTTGPAPEMSQSSATQPQVSPDAANAGCGTSFGTRFNLEPRPNALPQNSTSVDFLPNAGSQGADLVVGGAADFRGFFGSFGNSASGYYVHRNGGETNPCAPDFEGGLPPITSSVSGEQLFGGGVAATAADPARGAVFMADVRIGLSATAVGLFRTTAATLNDTSACPSGTHGHLDSQNCWPVSAQANPTIDLEVAESLAVDPRVLGTGTGAGDVYVSFTLSTIVGVFQAIAVCTNSLSTCSPAVPISGADTSPTGSQVRVRPDVAAHPNGGITVTYLNTNTGGAPGFLQTFDIKYVTCTPAGAPNPPVCSPAKLIATESQPIPAKGSNLGGLGNGALAASQFSISTAARHAHRADANGVETYVVWDRCHVPAYNSGSICPDADVILAASNDNGATWHSGSVDTATGDQYFPAIATDAATNNVNIAYYSTTGDAMNHRAKVVLRQIRPGPATPDPPGVPQTLTSVAMEPAADFMLGNITIGGYIGLAARTTTAGGRAYVHYMHNVVNGAYNGAPAPEQNNHLARFDY